MASETIEIGGTEVEVRETEDGFEAVERDDFVRYLEDEHCGEMHDHWGGAERTTPRRESNTRWSDGDAAVYDDTKMEYDGPHGASRSLMRRLDEDDNVTILGTGVNDDEDRFEVHLADER